MAEALAALQRGDMEQPLRFIVRPAEAAGLMGLMPAYRARPEAAYALKAVCVFPGNPARGLDAHQGAVLLFDGETGVLRAAVNASAITAIRTAAVSAVATRLLAREDARVARRPRRRRAGALAPAGNGGRPRLRAGTGLEPDARIRRSARRRGSSTRPSRSSLSRARRRRSAAPTSSARPPPRPSRSSAAAGWRPART